MHWVDRGEEPPKLENVRSQYTQGWVERHQRQTGSWPTPRWRPFHEDLCKVFYGLCGYCEEVDKGEVDHFKPASKFPLLVYEWSNWIFACHNCNQSKSSKWPTGGFVDPCAHDESRRPEQFFEFHTESKRLVPRTNLPSEDRDKAFQMIEDLHLNAWHHITEREERLYFIEHHLDGLVEDSDAELEFLERIASRSSALSSITRKALEERGIIIED